MSRRTFILAALFLTALGAHAADPTEILAKAKEAVKSSSGIREVTLVLRDLV